MWRACLLSVLLLAACVERGRIVIVSTPDTGAAVIPVLVASNRLLSADNAPTRERTSTISYARYDVSIPPDRPAGQVQWPGDPADPSVEFVTRSAVKFRDSNAFLNDVRRRVAQMPAGRRHLAIFVPGYNMNFAEGTYRLAQMVHDYGMNVVPVFFSWPSAESTLGYVHDRDSILYSRQALEDVIRLLNNSGAERITVLTHSLGGFLMSEVLRQIELRDPGTSPELIDTLVMFSPDIDLEVFLSQMSGIPALPEPFIIFTSQEDRALRLSSKLGGNKPRVGSQASLAQLSDLDIILIDISAFQNSPGDLLGHFSIASSPELIEFLSKFVGVSDSLSNTIAANPGALSSTVLNMRKATEVVLTPEPQ